MISLYIANSSRKTATEIRTPGPIAIPASPILLSVGALIRSTPFSKSIDRELRESKTTGIAITRRQLNARLESEHGLADGALREHKVVMKELVAAWQHDNHDTSVTRSPADPTVSPRKQGSVLLPGPISAGYPNTDAWGSIAPPSETDHLRSPIVSPKRERKGRRIRSPSSSYDSSLPSSGSTDDGVELECQCGSAQCSSSKEYENDFMIQCPGCKQWFFGFCVGISELDQYACDRFECDGCGSKRDVDQADALAGSPQEQLNRDRHMILRLEELPRFNQVQHDLANLAAEEGAYEFINKFAVGTVSDPDPNRAQSKWMAPRRGRAKDDIPVYRALSKVRDQAIETLHANGLLGRCRLKNRDCAILRTLQVPPKRMSPARLA